VLSRWPIRNKLLVGIALLLVIELTLSVSGFQGTYAYRELARSISSRGRELPPATALEGEVANLRVTLSDLEAYDHASVRSELSDAQLVAKFNSQFEEVGRSIREYAAQLDDNERAEFRLGDVKDEREKLAQIQLLADQIAELTSTEGWHFDPERTSRLKAELLVQLQDTAKYLPYQLQQRFINLVGEVRLRYRTWIVLTWICAIAATALVVVFIALGYRWIFRPLRLLVKGSRRVAGGDFNYRIELPSFDEMAELAEAMNAMTARFRAIRDDLDRQVQLALRARWAQPDRRDRRESLDLKESPDRRESPDLREWPERRARQVRRAALR
jgi:HAMP domain-containing protein